MFYVIDDRVFTNSSPPRVLLSIISTTNFFLTIQNLVICLDPNGLRFLMGAKTWQDSLGI